MLSSPATSNLSGIFRSGCTLATLLGKQRIKNKSGFLKITNVLNAYWSPDQKKSPFVTRDTIPQNWRISVKYLLHINIRAITRTHVPDGLQKDSSFKLPVNQYKRNLVNHY